MAIEDHYSAALRRRRAAAQPGRRGRSRWPTSWRRWSACSRIGQEPTGDKDPYALRRHALGADRLRLPTRRTARHRRSLALLELADAAIAATARARLRRRSARRCVKAFVSERYFQQLAAASIARAVDAVLEPDGRPAADVVEPRWSRCAQFVAPARGGGARGGEQARRQHPEEASEASAAGGRRRRSSREPRRGRRSHAAPRRRRRRVADRCAASRRLRAVAARSWPALSAPVDAFFDNVMVNVDDAALRANRLALLGALRATMNRVADLSRLAG